MGNRLTDIALTLGGATICKATEGDASPDRATVKLTQGINWSSSVTKPLDYLQKQVTLTSKIHDSGPQARSFAKPMYIAGISGGYIRLTDKKEA